MTYSFYHINESSVLNEKYGSKTYSFDHVGQPCLGLFVYEYKGTVLQHLASLNLFSHVYETRKFLMAILDWKQGLLCDIEL